MGVRAEEPEMKVLLALTFLLAFLALGLSEPDTDRDVELLREQLAVRDKREPAKGGKGGKKKGVTKESRKTKPKRRNSKGKKELKTRKKTGNKKIGGKNRKSIFKKRNNKGKKKTTANKKKRKLTKRRRKNLQNKTK